ncbi:lysM domain receptor-like kinase 3 [Rutidosis leptorrhynchoides]|uniref:lysM domain receptor-like kinase 3 n=1 Tax=Rutidosis leptorrhynchoides TaxID=125765 RepID=UPI003A9A068D
MTNKLNQPSYSFNCLFLCKQFMASHKQVSLLIIFTSFLIQTILALPTTNEINQIPFTCSKQSKPCNSILYQNNDLTENNISSLYSVNKSQIQTFGQGDHLVTVPCSCQNVDHQFAYFYDTVYSVKPDDTFLNVSDQFYSGQAWEVGTQFINGTNVTMHLLCGCTVTDSQVMITYTVEQHDTLSDIASRLSADVAEIENVNKDLIQKPGFIEAGWVLYVPMYKNGVPSLTAKKGSPRKNHKWEIVLGVLLAVIALLLCMSLVLIVKRKRSRESDTENSKVVSKAMSYRKSGPQHTRYLSKENMDGITGFDTERPLVYDLDEISEATNNFDDSRKIGEGGYGSVYFGILGGKEVAVKKMRSNKSKEFLAELKVLCKIHHINVVELLGFASGDDHLYLVYEFVSNGSLSEHLHDPLLKGHQPLSWTARAQIALDAAKGIEYIHDHTKERYVHRDIKTSNILLDGSIRAKVADFGLAKLVGRTNDDDFIATRLVGTPGYLPPESVKELHVTTKTDVFAFGVVLAELITGKRALMRDNRESNKMKSLITIITKVFEEEDDPEAALVSIRDGSMRDSYPMDDLYKMAEISYWCLSEDPNNRPEIREVVESLARIVMSSVEWEASLGGSSQVFSGVFDGR